MTISSGGEVAVGMNGIVVFADIDDKVLEAVRNCAHRGGRLLAVCAAGQAPKAGSWVVLRAGASDVVAWSDGAAKHVAGRLRRWQTIDALICSHSLREELVGESPPWLAALREIVEIAHFTNANVLITGESGTGKEHVARLVHELDPRPTKGDLVVLDCTTIVPALSGSEFFGHEKGAFTGAIGARQGAFELANSGTLFLDEVGELAVPLQAELLRVIQEGTFKRVGSNTWRKSKFRLVCATNRDLSMERLRGTFRNDFFHRIAGTSVHLPPLRERSDDVVPLFEHFYRQALPSTLPVLDDPVRALLIARSYPGNVRDLRSLAMRIAYRQVGEGKVTVGDVPEDEWPPMGDPQLAGSDLCQDQTPMDPALTDALRKAVECGIAPEKIATVAAELSRQVPPR